MKSNNYAAIDIGSNAVRLLVKQVSMPENGGTPEFSKKLFLRVPLRLGFDSFQKGSISPAKAEKLLRLMKAYRQLMKIYEVNKYRACATSAMRDAANGKELIRKIREEGKIKIEIIPGEEEAQIIYNNHIERIEDRTGNFLYVDVGGGSTEVNFLHDGQLRFSASYNIGTVRVLSKGIIEKDWRKMADEVARTTASFPGTQIIGSGGNINRLYRLAEDKDKEKQVFPVGELQRLYDRLLPLTPEERMEAFRIKADRADVIVPAARIFLTLAQACGAQYIHVPVIGLADGIIDTLYKQDMERPDAAPGRKTP